MKSLKLQIRSAIKPSYLINFPISIHHGFISKINDFSTRSQINKFSNKTLFFSQQVDMILLLSKKLTFFITEG